VAGYRTEGVILKRVNFGEADKLLTLFSKHFGKVRLLAKGIRKTQSRKGGNLELFNWVKIYVAKGRNLDIITEVELIDPFKSWRKSLERVALAYHLVELVDRLTAEEAKSRRVFELLTGSLEKLAGEQDLERLRTDFEVQLLEELGFWPQGKSAKEVDLQAYIEKLIEKRLNSKQIFKELNG
jgi:DNA repair protein RecO (recombination protein O)